MSFYLRKFWISCFWSFLLTKITNEVRNVAESVLLLGIEIIVLNQSNLEFKQFLGVGKNYKIKHLADISWKMLSSHCFWKLALVANAGRRRPSVPRQKLQEVGRHQTSPSAHVTLESRQNLSELSGKTYNTQTTLVAPSCRLHSKIHPGPCRPTRR